MTMTVKNTLFIQYLSLSLCLLLISGFAPATLAAGDDAANLDAFLDQFQEKLIALSPEYQTSLGRKTHYSEWSDQSYAQDDRYHALYQDFCKQLGAFHPVSDDGKSNLAVARYACKNEALSYKWRYYSFGVNQMFSPFDSIPAFLINQQRIDNTDDATAYIARVAKTDELFAEILGRLQVQRKRHTLPPSFVFPKVVANIREQLKGKPFNMKAEKDTAILADFKKKVAALKLDEARSKALVAQLTAALSDSYGPALEHSINVLNELQKDTTDTVGVWSLPDGDAYYRDTLKRRTTTDLSPEEIHERGLKEVARIESEMRDIVKSLDFDGSLQDFFTFLRNDPQFRYPNTEAGRNQYLADTRERYDEVRAKLPEYFGRLPKAPLIVKRVEPFREKNTYAAFYQHPSLDGSRPGIYYVPSYRISELLKWNRDSTAFHEGIPGHHMQIAIAQELDQPLFIRLRHFTAFTEGWALYAERLAKEMGLYKGHPYGDFGRLSSEIFRSIRLVVDTGIHAKHWTRQQAVDYMTKHSPLPKSFIKGEINRYCVLPGQATTYKTGMMKILALRAKAKEELGDRFDIRKFHDVVLTHGSVPLSVLEENVDRWIAETKSKNAQA